MKHNQCFMKKNIILFHKKKIIYIENYIKKHIKKHLNKLFK